MPYGIIIETSIESMSRDLAVQNALLEGGAWLTDEDRAKIAADLVLHGYGEAHKRRVAALGRALALVRGAPLPSGSMDNWKGLKAAL